MSNDPQQRSDQIAYHLYTKLVLVVHDARNSATQPREVKGVDKWFNLETPDTDYYRDSLRSYKNISQLDGTPPPLEVQVLLTVPELTNNQVLVQHPPNASRVRVQPTPSHVLLESWRLSFTPSNTSSGSQSSNTGSASIALPTVYKHAMSIFRSVYTLTRVLPTWRFSKRLRRPGPASRNGSLGIAIRVNVQGVDASTSADTRYLHFDTPLSASTTALQTETRVLDPVQHPMGVFTFAVSYLTAPHFEIDTVEALLSSRFLSLDVGPPFTPTLQRNAQRDSVLGSAIGAGTPGSLPLRTSLPRSPPSSPPRAITEATGSSGSPAVGAGGGAALADRFVLPANTNAPSASRTSFPSLSPRSRNVPLPTAGLVQRSTSAQAATGPGSYNSIASSRFSREEGREGGSSTSSRGRKESLGMGRGSDMSSAQGPIAMRRQSTTVNAFKSSTLLSSSPSMYSQSPTFRQGSPATGPTLPSAPPIFPTRPNMPPSPTSSRSMAFRSSEIGVSSPLASAGERSSGIAALYTGSSPVLPLRPSPPTPFAPSSLGERRPISIASTSQEAPQTTQPLAAPPRKRYSSSFGYRRGVAGSDGSGGSVDKGKEPERVEGIQSTSYLSSNTDDDDITAFIKDNEAFQTIGIGGGFNSRHERERTISERGTLGERPTGLSTAVQEREHRVRTISEGLGTQSAAARAATRLARGDKEGLRREPTLQEVSEPPTRQASGSSALALHLDINPSVTNTVDDTIAAAVTDRLGQIAIDERLRMLTDRYNATMEGIERRSDSTALANANQDASAPEPPVSAGLPRMRPPSVGGSPLRPVPESSPLGHARRVASTPGGPVEYLPRGASLRRRTDSGSGASLASVAGFYGQGRAARGSAASVGGASIGSEEVVGKLEMEQ